MEFRGRGWVTVLLEAIEDFRRMGEEGQGSSSPSIQRGREGTLRNLTGRCPGGPTRCVTKGRASPWFPIPFRWEGQGQSSASPTSPNPLPTAHVPRFQKVLTAHLRHPPHCHTASYPMANSPAPPNIAPLFPMPPNYEHLFPLPIMPPIACCSIPYPESLYTNPPILNTWPHPSLLLSRPPHLFRLFWLWWVPSQSLWVWLRSQSSPPIPPPIPLKQKKNWR